MAELPRLNSNGLYKIVNNAFPTQVADLIGGNPTGPVSGYHKNSDSNNQSWTIRDAGRGGADVTFENGTATSSFASTERGVEPGTEARGNTEPTVWSLFGVGPGVLQITKDYKYTWVLEGGQDYSRIVLKEFDSNRGPQAQWHFEPAERVN